MRKLVLLLVVLVATSLFAQDRFQISVKSAETNNGVVIVTAQTLASAPGTKTQIELQCNESVSSCTAPAAGTYLVVQLPKNRGIYECANVDIFPGTTDPPTAPKVGQYCLTEK